MEVMNLEQLAAYLQRDARDLRKWASRGYIPAQKVGGEWRFHRAEIHHWLETQMHAYTEQELLALERGGQRQHEEEPLLTVYLSERTISVPLAAKTKTAVLHALLETAEQSWQLYNPQAILEAVRTREEMCSTALASGVAIPHPRRPLPGTLGDHVIAFGRTASGIPFGGAEGSLTDLFFLVLAKDERTHLQILARLSRLLLRPQFSNELRAAETAADAFQVIESAEKDLIG
jgi:PTS system nitrogen regulatory IIA component